MTTSIRFGAMSLCLLTLANVPAPAADDAAIQKAIEQGVTYLKQHTQARGGQGNVIVDAVAALSGVNLADSEAIGATALVGLTLLECGVGSDDPVIRKTAETLRSASVDLTYTYGISLSIMFFDRLGDPGDVPLIESLMVRLLAGQNSHGGWSYNCPAIADEEVRRLKNINLKPREGSQPKRGTPAGRAAARDLPPQIKDQLTLINRNQGAWGAGDSGDNSNTQFATLALWVGRRHGLPVDKALAQIEARYRKSQNADGSWGYQVSGQGGTPSMTCAGLLGMAVACGAANEALERLYPARKDPAKEDPASKKDSPPKPVKLHDPGRDPVIRAGLLAVSTAIGQPEGIQGPGPAANGADNPALPGKKSRFGGRFRDYYFFWSLERVAMAFGLETIGKKDWYGWGAEIVVASQLPDGSWSGAYPQGGADTCFALLFLKRSNLANDLTASLKGKILDPGTVKLKAGGVGGEGLANKGATAPKNPSSNDRTPSNSPLQGAGASTRPPAEGTIPLLRADAEPEDPEVARLRNELVGASSSQQEVLIAKLRTSKGLVHTQALATAIPRLGGTVKTKAREALAERMSRMTGTTLVDKLQDEDREIRRAASLACALKEDKTFIPNLIRLLEDPESLVTRAAHAALKSLTGRDFGPSADAGGEDIAKAVAAWRDWWTKHGG